MLLKLREQTDMEWKGRFRAGWPPTSRAQFDATRGRRGAGGGRSGDGGGKAGYVDEALGGVSRFTLHLTAGTLPHAKVMRATELLGTRVAPVVRARAAERVGVVASAV